MKFRLSLLIVVVVFLLPGTGFAQYPYSLIPTDETQIFSQFGSYGTGVQKTSVSVFDAPAGSNFTQAIRFRNTAEPASEYNEGEWSMGANLNLGVIPSGDLIVVRFWYRSIEPVGGLAATRVNIERAGDPYTKVFVTNLLCQPQWRKYERYGYGVDFSGTRTQLALSLGFGIQAFEIGGLSVVNHGKNVSPESLGLPAQTYEGSEADAPWRAAAAQRIEQYRKANLSVLVTDRMNRPIPGAEVRVRMLRHSFGFGSAVPADRLVGTSANDGKFRQMFERLFNKAVFENDLKWARWEDPNTPPKVFASLDWLRARQIDVRGHVLVWPGWTSTSGNVPADVRALTGDPLRNRIKNHILQEAGTPQLASTLVEWDVLNEPYSNHTAMDLLGKQEMGNWFTWANQADPDVKLYINEYDILAAGGANLRKQAFYVRTIDYLKNQLGVPIHGIGFQGHFSSDLTPIPRTYDVVEQFGQLGLEMQITEFDVNVKDEQLQAQYTRDFMTMMFSHPRVVGFMLWGFWAGSHWLPDGAMYRYDWSAKPNAVVFDDLVFNQWWTNADLLSNDNGIAATRGFKGNYEIEVVVNGIRRMKQVRLDNDSSVAFQFSFDPTADRSRYGRTLQRGRKETNPR